MSIINEIGSGGATITSDCSLIMFSYKIHTTWGPGDVLYNIDKARVGVLEKVVVKKQRLTMNSRTKGFQNVIYVDTFNALWNEWDLVVLSEAQTVAVAYLERQLAALNSLNSCPT
jgi:hypothetical protein